MDPLLNPHKGAFWTWERRKFHNSRDVARISTLRLIQARTPLASTCPARLVKKWRGALAWEEADERRSTKRKAHEPLTAGPRALEGASSAGLLVLPRERKKK